jgi:hypothetical protein
MRRRSFLRISGPAGAALALGSPLRADDTAANCRVVSGLSGAAVPGARLRVAGREVVSDAAGRATLAGLVFPWTPVEIEAEGHVVRRTCVREGGDISLWPVDAGMTPDYVRGLVYGEAGVLVRPVADVVDLVPHGALVQHRGCMGAIRRAAAEASRAFGISLRVIPEAEAAEASPERPRVDLVVDPADPVIAATGSRAVFFRRTRGATLVGGHLALAACEVAHHEATLLHELGHLFLLHSPDPADLMAEVGGDVPRAATFSPRELAVLRLVRQRHPGNRPHDDDRELGPRPDRVAGGSLLHRVVYAASLRADDLFAVRGKRAAGPVRAVVCCA